MNEHKQQALQIISVIAADCQMDPDLYQAGKYTENMQEIECNVDYLRCAVEGEVLGGETNPAYHHFDQAAEKLLRLSVEYPEIFNKMFIFVLGDTTLRTLVGLRCFTNFLRLIVDDHEYRLDSSSGLPVITEYEDPQFPMIAPAMLYRALSKIC